MSITIKQAFQKLAMVTGAALKNPWFVGRNLNQAFADIAENIVDEGGSEVEVTQVLESGTKIATISVDSVSTDLYAPSTISQDYSTTERVVGKWIDGTTDVYEITYDVDDLTFTNQTAVITSSFSNKLVISYEGAVTSADGANNASLTGLPGVGSWEFGIHMDAGQLVLYAASSSSATRITGGRVITRVRYLKLTT